MNRFIHSLAAWIMYLLMGILTLSVLAGIGIGVFVAYALVITHPFWSALVVLVVAFVWASQYIDKHGWPDAQKKI